MIGSALLALGLVLTTSSQLRLRSVPVGPGEVCLVLWLGLASLRILTGSILNAGALLRLGTFWVCFALILSVGTCVAILRDELDPDTMLHDTFAYLLVAAISCLVAATMKADITLRQSQWFLIAFWNIAMVVQLALGWEFIHMSSVYPWYWDRFQGWSENPNQLALYCAVLTPLSLHLALSAKGFGRLAAAFSCLLSFVVGRLTKSDTFLGAMALSTILFFVLRLRSWLTSAEHRFSLRFAAAALLVVALVPLSLSLMPYAAETADDVESLAAGMTKDRGGEATKRTAALRASLWEDALYVGIESGSLGLGPGPHLGKPGLTERGVPLPLEAHNTLMDVFTQAGLLGVIAVCSLFAGIFQLLLRAKLDALAILIAALAVFSLPHLILRHPIVWFVLALSLILSSQRAPSLRARIGT